MQNWEYSLSGILQDCQPLKGWQSYSIELKSCESGTFFITNTGVQEFALPSLH
jgi:hypothetical protein